MRFLSWFLLFGAVVMVPDQALADVTISRLERTVGHVHRWERSIRTA